MTSDRSLITSMIQERLNKYQKFYNFNYRLVEKEYGYVIELKSINKVTFIRVKPCLGGVKADNFVMGWQGFYNYLLKCIKRLM